MPIEKTDKIWMDGEFVGWDEANVHVLTHALHYGDGVFEGIRAYKAKSGTAIFRLTDHMRRLHRSAKILMMDVPYSVDQLVDATRETIRVNALEAGYIRPLVFYGFGEMGLNPLNNPVKVAIAAWPWGTYLGEEGLASGVRVKISSWTRIDANSYPPQMKSSGGYLNSILAKLEVLKAGYDEALFLTPNGYIAEGPGESFFIVRDGALLTPPLTSGGLDSITRDSVITIARDLGYEVREQELVRADVYFADEAFFTGTAAELTPIREVDDRLIGDPGPITRKLQETFFAAARGELETYRDWNEYV
jgi:branched-chain amino acid aminotransferase